MSKTSKGIQILLSQINQGKYKVINGELFNNKGIKLGSIKENGYIKYYVREGDFKCGVLGHRLMYAYYHDDIDDTLTINHKDGNKLNNTNDNLEQITRGENTKHSIKTGLQQVKGSNNGSSKLNESKVTEIKQMLLSGNYTQKEIAKKYKVTPTLIGYIKKGKSWTHVEVV